MKITPAGNSRLPEWGKAWLRQVRCIISVSSMCHYQNLSLIGSEFYTERSHNVLLNSIFEKAVKRCPPIKTF